MTMTVTKAMFLRFLLRASLNGSLSMAYTSDSRLEL